MIRRTALLSRRAIRLYLTYPVGSDDPVNGSCHEEETGSDGSEQEGGDHSPFRMVPGADALAEPTRFESYPARCISLGARTDDGCLGSGPCFPVTGFYIKIIAIFPYKTENTFTLWVLLKENDPVWD